MVEPTNLKPAFCSSFESASLSAVRAGTCFRLRGRFLRGADLGAGRDLDRINRNEGLGTAQRDNFKQHVHTPAGGGRFVVEGAGLDKAWVGTARGFTTPLQTSIAGGTETRPMNVAVNWIIKY